MFQTFFVLGNFVSINCNIVSMFRLSFCDNLRRFWVCRCRYQNNNRSMVLTYNCLKFRQWVAMFWGDGVACFICTPIGYFVPPFICHYFIGTMAAASDTLSLDVFTHCAAIALILLIY